jgi:IS5 family transposase
MGSAMRACAGRSATRVVAAVCRIPLDRPVPHPTTLVKLVGRAGPEIIAQLNTALLGKLREDKLLRGRKLRVDTTVVEADPAHATKTALAMVAQRIQLLEAEITLAD